MEYAKKYKLEKIVAEEGGRRPSMAHVRLEVKGESEARLIACHGRALAIVPCTPCEGDTTGVITVEAFKAGRKAFPGPTLRCNGSLEVPGGPSFPRPDPEKLGEYPPVDKVIPRDDAITLRLGIDAKLLWELAQALGSDGVVELEIQSPNEAVRVKPDHGEALGVIMPVVIDRKNGG